MLERYSFAIAAADSLPYFTYEVANLSSKIELGPELLAQISFSSHREALHKASSYPSATLEYLRLVGDHWQRLILLWRA